MESALLMLLAFVNVLQPIVDALHGVLGAIYGVVHNYGWTLIILALIVKGFFWPLNTMQYKSMLKTQQLQPRIKALQQKHKNDREKLNAETMALYKETGANPLAGCLPLLLQMPILFSLYAAINGDRALFASQKWLWIGSPMALGSPHHILAANLAMPDYVLLVLYIVSMYFSVRFTSPALDEQQAQQQRIMSFISPAMVGYMGFKFAWPSALIIYWLSFNVFTMAQQLYLMRRYPRGAAGALLGAKSRGDGSDGGTARGAGPVSGGQVAATAATIPAS
ncbi:MAG: YidC/Oxa1 family membrane protein insertase, partial [Candidatus Eremiobacteraeota bacterium]|nr:YidC/Oxa1 family membrane protein insertase [Candidatus Eremiobacteraeota bacterium]